MTKIEKFDLLEMDGQFKIQEIDKVSSIPTLHFSYIVQQLLPVRLVGSHRFKDIDKGLEQYSKGKENEVIPLPVGSLAEGLHMPPVILKSGKKTIKGEYSDRDLMIINTKKQITFDESKLNDDYIFGLAETDSVHIGYARINIFDHQKLPVYYNQNRVKQRFYYYVQQKLGNDERLDACGPAITLLAEKQTNTDKKTSDGEPSTDYVFALPCKEWPPIATDWIKRSHDKGWLKSSFIQSVTEDGCHFVHVAHKLSPEPEIEWRISFVATERRIAREILTDSQRQAYILIKLLYNHALKEKEVLTSYHLKNIFFYACEKIPPKVWDENVGACIFHALDLIIDCIKRKYVPSFFVPENNLIDYLPKEELQSFMEPLLQLRNDPITTLLQFTDDKVIGFSIVSHPFRSVISPVLSDMKQYIEHKDIHRTVLEAFIPTSFDILIKQLAEGKPEESVHVATDLHAMLVNHKLTDQTLPKFLSLNIANRMTDGRMSVSFLEAVITLHEDDQEFDCCKNHLPCMYHAAAYRYPPNSKEHKEYLDKADKAFVSRFSQQGVSGAYCDYVLLLMKQNRHSEAITWLDKVIEDNNDNYGNVYDANEIMTVDQVIQNEIVEHNSFSAPSKSLAYYLKAVCLHTIGEDKKGTMNHLLENFKLHSDVEKLPRTYALLGYCYMDCGQWKAASDTMSLAIKADTEGVYTRAVKMKNYCDKMINEKTKESI